jgi:CelD/BcsL family acetyltransferase involved in cellulose biosynthesis
VTAVPGTLGRREGSPTIELVDQFEPLRGDWTRLAAATGNVFAVWEWNELWWRHYGRGRRLRIAVSRREDGEIDAIVPLFSWSRRPLRTLRLIGHGHGDRLGPICRHDDTETAAEVFRLALAAEPHDIFVGDWVAGDRDWASILGGRVVRTTGYPILRFGDASWDEFLARQSRRFRKSVRSARNRLERAHEVSYRSADAASLEHDLDAAFRLHRARFGEHRGCLFCGEHERFQREFAALALERGWLRLLLLEVDGAPVCCEYGFIFESAYFAYQGGRDPAWDRHSVGFLLEVESIHRTLAEGAAEYRFLGGEEDYKYRYRTEDPRLETVIVPATRRGGITAAALDAVWRLPGGRATLRRIASARAGLGTSQVTR